MKIITISGIKYDINGSMFKTMTYLGDNTDIRESLELFRAVQSLTVVDMDVAIGFAVYN